MTVAAIDRSTGRITPPAIAGGHWRRPRSVEVGTEPQKLLDQDPRRIAAWIQNLGGALEIPIQLPGASLQAGAALPLAAFLDSAGIPFPAFAASSYKSFVIVVDTQLTWGGGATQSKVQFVAGRQPWGPSSGAATGVGPGTGNQNFTKGGAVNWGAAGNAIAVGAYGFDASDIANLQWPYPYVGLELQMGAALTAGSARLFLEAAGGPNLLLGKDRNMNAPSGPQAWSWPIIAASPPVWVPDPTEVWAMAGPGGAVDCRIWELMAIDPDDPDQDQTP